MSYISHRDEQEKKLIDKLTKNMAKAAFMVEGEAKRLCPVDTGRLRASIASRVETEDSEIVGIIGTNVEYAPAQEFGTVKMPAHPFLYPALEGKKKEIEELLKA